MIPEDDRYSMKQCKSRVCWWYTTFVYFSKDKSQYSQSKSIFPKKKRRGLVSLCGWWWGLTPPHSPHFPSWIPFAPWFWGVSTSMFWGFSPPIQTIFAGCTPNSRGKTHHFCCLDFQSCCFNHHFCWLKHHFRWWKPWFLLSPSGPAHSFAPWRMAEGKSISGNWRPVSFWMLDLGAGGGHGHQTWGWNQGDFPVSYDRYPAW